MKVFLALRVKKSVLKELAFAKSDFLVLVNFGFLDLTDFAAINRFLILLPTLLPSAPPAAPGIS